jgi:hypothetical protein
LQNLMSSQEEHFPQRAIRRSKAIIAMTKRKTGRAEFRQPRVANPVARRSSAV